MKNPVIEHENLELDRIIQEISQEGRKEKNTKNPLNDLFYWWTRKPLALSRASVILSILENQKDVKQFLNLDLEKRSFYYPIDSKKLKEIYPKLQSIKILDLFAGSGNLIFESARLGMDTFALDYNPLPYLILKGIFEYPKKYPTLANDVKTFGEKLINTTKTELSEYFDSSILAFIWLWCVNCPHCGQKIPLTNNMWISRKQKLGFKIIPDENLDCKFELIKNISDDDASKYTQKGGKALCSKCNNSLDYQTITESIKNNKERKLVFVKTDSQFRLATNNDIESFEKSQKYLDQNWQEFLDLKHIPQDEIKPDPRSGIKNYGINFWHQYFSKRQLLVFATLSKNIKKICQEIPDKEYQKVIATYLSFILGKHLDANSLGVHWHTGTENPEYTLSFRRTNFVFNHAEPNPFAQVRGNLYSILEDIVNSIKFCQESGVKSKVQLQSAFDLSKFSDFDLILVDPPNPNDIQFAEQSEFFYVWMSKILCDYYSEIPQKIPIDEDISDSPGRFGNRKISLSFYKKGLIKIMTEINSTLKEDGLVLFYFSPSHNKAWNLLVDVLRDSKFRVSNLHSIHLENVTNVMPQLGVESLSTILITCRKDVLSESVYYEDLVSQIENQIIERLDKFTLNELFSISINDLFVISFSKILQIVTKYSDIRTYEKQKEIDLDLLIEQIQKSTALYLFNRISSKSVSVLGNQIAMYVFLKSFYDKIASDELEKLAKSFGIKRNYLETIKMVVREKEVFRLAKFDEFIVEERPSEISSENLYSQICYCYQNLDKIKSKVMKLDDFENFKQNEIFEVAKSLIQVKSILGEFDDEMQKLNDLFENCKRS